MSKINQENRDRQRIGKWTALLSKYILSVVGMVLTVSGFVALVTANSARLFVKEHPYPIYLALVIAVLVILAALNWVHVLLGRNSELEDIASRSESPRPSRHDVRFYTEAIKDIPVDGSVVTWLKCTQMTKLSIADFPADVLRALEKTAERPRMRPVGFDDREIAAAFGALIDAVKDFLETVEHWTFGQHNARWRAGVTELLPTTVADRATWTSALAASHVRLIRAYDTFIITAHTRGIEVCPLSGAGT